MSGVRVSRKSGRKLLVFGVMILGAALTWLCSADRTGAADRGAGGSAIVSEISDVQKVRLTVNKSRTFRVETPFSTVVAGSPDIADVRSLSDHVIYIQGKQTGTTNVILFDGSLKQIGILDVEVAFDTGNLQQNIQSSTGTRGIRVSSAEGQVVLSGTATDAVAAERAMAIATGKNNQVLKTGLNPGNINGINLNQRITPPTPGIPVLETAGTLIGAAAPFGNILTRVLQLNNGTTVDLLLTALETKGLLRRLAEPNLMALSGDSARFLAGGEFPVPVVQGGAAGTLPTVTIQFKTFGVELAFVPTVLSRGVINLRIEPSVSELDFTNGVSIGGTTVPALSRRDARTTVELRDGQSFAIAGLLQTRNVQDISQVPWIGSVPVLGTLFRSSSYQQHETDLVIIVTPRLVAPAAPGQTLASPLDSRLPANDVDFFLNGQMEVRKRYSDYVSSGGDIKGPYGHIIGPEVRAAEPAVVVTDQPVLKTKD